MYARVHVTPYWRRGATMSVLTIASSKGGPGKTTICQLLAGSLAGEFEACAS